MTRNGKKDTSSKNSLLKSLNPRQHQLLHFIPSFRNNFDARTLRPCKISFSLEMILFADAGHRILISTILIFVIVRFGLLVSNISCFKITSLIRYILNIILCSFQSFQWMSRVLQAVDSIHQVGLYCLALVPPNYLPKTPLGGIHLSECKRKFLEGNLHPANVLLCPHTCVTNLPKPREIHSGNN